MARTRGLVALAVDCPFSLCEETGQGWRPQEILVLRLVVKPKPTVGRVVGEVVPGGDEGWRLAARVVAQPIGAFGPGLAGQVLDDPILSEFPDRSSALSTEEISARGSTERAKDASLKLTGGGRGSKRIGLPRSRYPVTTPSQRSGRGLGAGLLA